MWFTLGLFSASKTERLKGTHIKDRWCMITGPHYRRLDAGKRREMCIDLAENMAHMAGYELQSTISVAEEDLKLYDLTTFPWLLVQSAFWNREAS